MLPFLSLVRINSLLSEKNPFLFVIYQKNKKSLSMNYKSLSLLIIVLFSACTLGAQNRKKVGIVLSGGGAKGVAHIGALKVVL